MLQHDRIERMVPVFELFSCVGFELDYGRTKLRTTGAFHGATEAWDYARRDPHQVYADIERRGDIWHVDVITNAYGSGRYDCWFASVYPSLVQAYRALQWLSRYDWKVLRAAPARPNSGRSLTEQQNADMHSYVSGVDLDPNHEAAGDAAEARAMSSAADE